MKKDNNALLQGLLDSKKECLEYLNDCFSDCIVAAFQRMYDACLLKPEVKSGKNILMVFQNQLSSVASWNQALITDEYTAAINRSQCKYVANLIRATLIVHVKVALMTNYSSIDIDKIKLRIPSPEAFYHRCLIIAASELWKQPFLFYHKVRTIEQQHNLNEVESIARKSIKNAVRIFIPMDQLLSMQLTTFTPQEDNNDDTSSEDVESEHSQEESASESSEDAESESCHEESDQDDAREDIQSNTAEDDTPCPVEDYESADGEEIVERHDEDEDIPVPEEEPEDDVRVEEVSPPKYEEPVNKKIVLGSMLMNKPQLKIPKTKLKSVTKPLRLTKKDSFF